MARVSIGEERITIRDEEVETVTEAVRAALRAGEPFVLDLEDAHDGRRCHVFGTPSTPVVISAWR